MSACLCIIISFRNENVSSQKAEILIRTIDGGFPHDSRESSKRCLRETYFVEDEREEAGLIGNAFVRMLQLGNFHNQRTSFAAVDGTHKRTQRKVKRCTFILELRT